MRSPKDFFKPLAVGAPQPLREIPVRPSRVIHFFPPQNEKMVAKLPDIVPTVDVLLGNLEDAIPMSDKEAARAGLVKVGREIDMGQTQLWTRVNSLDSPWCLDDLTTLVTEIGDKLDVIMIPKVEGPEDIHYVDRLLAQLEAKAGLAKPLMIHAILETARGVANIEEICSASPRMQGLCLGPADLAANRRMKTTRVGGGHPDYLVRADPSADDPDAPRATYQQDLWHYTIARMVDACVIERDPPVLRAVRRHQGRRRLRGPVPQRLPARLRRGVEPAPGADRDRQAGVQPAAGRRGPRPAGHRRDGRRHRRDDDRRQDGGRRLGQAVPRRRRPRQGPRRTRPRAGRCLRVRVMSSTLRPRRSVLYMPAANERALEKAKAIPADAIIFDLEDAVAPDAKADARPKAVAAASSGEYGNRELTIRCNGLDTQWGADDLAAAATSGAAAVVIPKVASVAYVDEVSARLDAAGAPADMTIWAMIETPTAIFDVRAIAAHPRVSVLVMGTNDLARELRAPLLPGRHPLVPHLATALLAAREAGKVILDGVFNDVKDLDGFRAECVQGWEMGFDGKTLIHPGQVDIANDVWAPSDDEVDYARRVIDAFDEGLAAGKGVVTVDGRMIENLHVVNAQRVLATAEAIASLS